MLTLYKDVQVQLLQSIIQQLYSSRTYKITGYSVMKFFDIVALRDTLHALSKLIDQVMTHCQVTLQVTYHISRLVILPMPRILYI